MNKKTIACIVAASAFFISASGSHAQMKVEGIVKDASGRIVLEGQIKESDIPALISFLKQDGTQAEYSRDILIKFGPAAVPALISALKGVDDAGYENIMLILRQVKDERAIKPIAALINHPSWPVANMARGALQDFGSAAMPVLFELTGKKDSRNAAVDILAVITPSENERKEVRQMANSRNPLERAAAGRLIGIWRDAKSKNNLTALLEDPENTVREAAVAGYLEYYRNEPAGFDSRLLTSLLNDPSPKVRLGAANIFPIIPSGIPVEAFVERMNIETDPEVIGSLLARLGESGNERAVFPATKIMMTEGVKESVLTSAIAALGDLEAEEAVPYIVAILSTERGGQLAVRQESFRALAKIGKPVDLKPYLMYLEAGDKHENSTAQLLQLIEATARPGDKNVINALGEFKKSLTLPSGIEHIDRLLEKLK